MAEVCWILTGSLVLVIEILHFHPAEHFNFQMFMLYLLLMGYSNISASILVAKRT